MSLNQGTFLKELDGLVTGQGFLRTIQGLDINSLRDADGTILTASTEPSREALETSFIGVVVSSSQTDLGTLSFQVPKDYDETLDEMRIKFLANMGGNTNDSIEIDAAVYQKVAGVALSADLDPTISESINTLAELAGEVFVDLSGLGLKAGAFVTVAFSTTAHTTDAVNIYGLEVEYRSDLVYFNEADRS